MAFFAERLPGECRRRDGRPITIASKFAPPLTRASRAGRARSSARSLLEALDHSLERLGIECIDLYQLHTASPVLKVDHLMDALAEAVQAGKVRAVGVSNYSASQMRQAYAHLASYGIPPASNQVWDSLLHRYPETNGVLDTCRELNVALMAYSPLEQGIQHAQDVEPLPPARYPWRYQGGSFSHPALVFDSPCPAAREHRTIVCGAGGNGGKSPGKSRQVHPFRFR
jgi:aryl-alcohol dehydrogenase-like predicted oxidoreductase